MKASPTVCAPSSGDVSASSLNGVSTGRVHKQRRDIENEEIQMYLSKLKELVPFMPKNKRLSKLEVIQHVIDYICDLQYALESHPKAEALISSALPSMTTAVTASSRLTPPTAQPRQPLGVLGVPNNIVPAGSASCSAQEQVSITAPPHLLEKVSTSDSRPVSC